MKLGFFLPQMGKAAGPDALVKVAQKAESLGFSTVWTTDRLLFPVNPRSPYAGTPDGSLPDVYRIVYDPLDSLTWVAANTKTLRLGTSVLDMPFYNPLTLARRLSTIDNLSGGRLTVGLGQGWSLDEYEATNADASKRGKRANEFLQALYAIWHDDPTEFDGHYFKIAASHIAPKPAQKPHPPVFLAAFTPPAMKRVAKYADGWHPVGMPIPVIAQMWGQIKDMAKEEGRNPDDLRMIMRGNLDIRDQPLGDGRFPFTGNFDEIKADVKAAEEIGTDELALDPGFGATSGQDFLDILEKARESGG